MASSASLRMASSLQHRQNLHSGRSSKSPATRRSVTPNSRAHSSDGGDEDYGRVRASVRLRPRNAEDLLADADFADCVELQPELKRLKLRKNNCSSESYRFDEVFTESSSQKRVYEVVAKPVVEVSCLQLYMESVQDLLAHENINIPIREDPRTGEVIVPGATVVKIRGLDHFVELLQTGEVNRHASNTKKAYGGK